MDRTTCPNCGAAIDADHPQGLCPACLLKKGLETTTPGAAPIATAAEGDPLRAALEAKLRGQYRIVRLLGRGGMGAVYLARDLALDREVAIKVVTTDSDAREMYDRFRREARTAAGLSHPHIVPLHAFGEVEGMPYFVMGYVRGESLAARLRRDGKLPEEEARRVVAEIASALDHAHRQGVVHRDIKPDNVLLEDESGRALLTDFGVAKAVGKGETLTRIGSVVGTPHFMSPEQAAGRADIDGRSDIYSLGVMAYAMLTGRLPFDGSTPAEVLTKHLTQQPPPLRSFAATVSDSTLQAVERCLAKDPAGRWPDARSLQQAVGTVEEVQLPDSLQGVQGQGVTFAAIALLLLLFVWMIVVKLQNAPAGVLLLNAGVVAIAYVAVITRLRFEGFSISQSHGAIWTEPAWWPFWYPRALRRQGNVWERLPAFIRHLRSWTLVVLTYLALCVYDASWLLAIKAGGLAVLLAFAILLEARARRELKRRGLAGAEIKRVLISMPPSRVSFWARPHLAALLAPATPPESGRRSEAPHAQLQSMLRHAAELSGPLRQLGAQAAVAARQVVASIDDADRQIAEWARNLEPGEEERLVAKIEALSDLDEYAPMRELLEKQLELIRALARRIEQAGESRNRRVEMLKTLSLHLASLRARAADAPTEVRSLTDRVRTLCDEIARQALPLEQMATVERNTGEQTS